MKLLTFSRFKRDFHLPFVISVFCCFILTLEYVQPRYFLWDDNATQFLIFYIHNFRSLFTDYSLPQFNFYQYIGQPYLAQGQTGVLYIPAYLAVYLSQVLFQSKIFAIDILAISHYFIAVIGMFRLLCYFGVSKWGASLVSLYWISLPFSLLISKSWINVSYFSAYMPWTTLFLTRLLRRGDRRDIIFFLFAKVLFFFHGNIQWIFLFSIFEFIYGVFVLRIDKALGRGGLRRWLRANLQYALLICPILLPMIRSTFLSAERSTSLSLDRFLDNSLPLREFFLAQLLYFKNLSGSIHLDTVAFFIGPAILLCFVALPRMGKGNVNVNSCLLHRFFFGAALFCLICSTSWYIWAHALPGFNVFRWPFKNFLLFNFFLSVSIGLSLRAEILATRIGQYVAYTLLCMGFLLNFAVLIKHPSSTIANYRLPLDYANSLEEVIPPGAGRVQSLKVRGNVSDDNLYRFHTFVYATLFRQFHLGGYDPLVSRLHYTRALGLRHMNSFEGEITEEVLDYFRKFGVRYLILPTDLYTRKFFNDLSGVSHLQHSKDLEILEIEDTSALVASCQYPTKPIPFSVRGNQLTFLPGAGEVEEVEYCLNFLYAPGFVAVDQDFRFLKIETDTYGRIRLRASPMLSSSITLWYFDPEFFIGLLLSFIQLLILGKFTFQRKT